MSTVRAECILCKLFVALFGQRVIGECNAQIEEPLQRHAVVLPPGTGRPPEGKGRKP